MIIACAGPFVNLVFIILLKDLRLIYVNILIFIFNMITIYPLDGGRILKNLLCMIFGKAKALSLVYIISNATAVLLSIIVAFLSIWLQNFALIFAVIYIWIILITENKKYKIKKEMYKILENYIAIN